ncbi:hypothetical protein X474_19870 [Dethiosulfatarculus sandiegensis]|uniref:Uncharacterized protein n=1 Tax=Dethiosulfatarculus sandiegensis TaxID=1429043 RepID=A0A0D2J972_9BACT|nr:hypothetical protein X474_19870 [Dethiosulfatarculus sandiegensis]
MAMLAGIIMPWKAETSLDANLVDGLFFGGSGFDMTFDLIKVGPYITC